MFCRYLERLVFLWCIMVYDSFNVSLDSVCLYFNEDFCIYIHQWYWPVISFFFNICTCDVWKFSLARGQIRVAAAACTTATATPNQSHICNLCHSLWGCLILNPLSKARNQTCILTETMSLLTHWATTGTSQKKKKMMSCLVLVSGWCWPYRMSSEVFLPLQVFGIVWEGYMFTLL